jgi:hypothetical protein
MTTGVAIASMMTRPPAYFTPIVVGGAGYYNHGNAYYRQVVYGGGAQYEIVATPPEAIVHYILGRLIACLRCAPAVVSRALASGAPIETPATRCAVHSSARTSK